MTAATDGVLRPACPARARTAAGEGHSGTCASTSCTATDSTTGSSPSTRATSPSRARTARPTASSAPTGALFDGIVSGEVNAMAAILRGELAVEGDLELLLPCSSGSFPGRRSHAPQRDAVGRGGGGHERRAGQDPRRQHVRRQRRARRHRGVADRPDRAVLVRHPLPLEVGAHRERRAAQRALHRRPAVLRDALLPRAGHGNRLRRREALGDPRARRRRRLPRRAHDPQPRRRAGRPRRSASRPAATSPTCSRSRTRSRRRARTTRGSRTGACCSATSARRSGARRRSRRRRRPQIDEHGPDLHRPDRAARRRGRPTCDVVIGAARAAAETRRDPSTERAEETGPAQACSGTWSSGSRTRRASSATGSRSRRRTGAASSTSPPCASRRSSPAGGACRPPACRGS